LAVLSKPADPGAPPPVRFANAGDDAMPTPAHLAMADGAHAGVIKTALQQRLARLGSAGIASE